MTSKGIIKIIESSKLSTEIEMLEDARILDEIEDFKAFYRIRNNDKELSAYQEELLKEKFPEKKFLILKSAVMDGYRLFIPKPLKAEPFHFEIHSDDGLLNVSYSAVKINVKLDYFLHANLERSDPVFIKYLQTICRYKAKLDSMQMYIDSIYSQFSDGEKLIGEVLE